MPLCKHIKRIPPRLFLSYGGRSDVRSQEWEEEACGELDAVEATNSLLSRYRNVHFVSSGDSTAAKSSDTSSYDGLIIRILDLSPDMDPVLLLRVSSALLGRSDGYALKFAEILLTRVEDFGLQQISRLLFSTSIHGNCSISEKLVKGFEQRVQKLLSVQSAIPARVLSKLCVSYSQIPETFCMLMPFIETSLFCLEEDQVQQVAFAVSAFQKTTGKILPIMDKLVHRAIALSPLISPKTYASLLISLTRLMKQDERDESLVPFGQIFRGHFGIPLYGHISLPKLRSSLEAKGFLCSDRQLRLVRTALMQIHLASNRKS